MRGGISDRKRHALVLVLAVVSLLALVAGGSLFTAAQQASGFGQGSGQAKGTGDGQRAGQGPGVGHNDDQGQGQGTGQGFFRSDQLLKLIVMAGLAGVALGFVAARGFKYRKWLLLLSVGAAGFYMAGLLCPLCSVQNVFLKWNTGYLLLVLLPVVLTLLVGRVYCGYVCPYGAIQELLHVRKWAPRIPERWRRPLRWLKYAILVFLVVNVLVTKTEILKDMTPFKALFALSGTPLTIGLAAGFAVLSVVTWRPFCEALCPLGALLSLLSRVSLFRLEADASCASCGACTTKCPATTCDGGTIRAADCYVCGECVRACGPKSLRLKFRWGRARTSCPPESK